MRITGVILFALALSTVPAHARVYHGAPDLALTAALVQAGGGAQHFDGARLLAALAGPALPRELAALHGRHGTMADDFVPLLNFAINDTLGLATKHGVQLPPANPSPADRTALVRAVWDAGHAAGGSWDVGIFLERLMTHPIHHELMHDLDTNPTVGPQRNAIFHEMLAETFTDLARMHHLGTTR